MEKTILKEIVMDQKNKKMPVDFVRRDIELKVKKDKGDHIVIISGIRRCGKSTLLNSIRQEKKESDYFLDFDDERLIDFSVNDFQLLYEVFLELFGEQKVFYFDEIQNISGWERFIRRLHDNGNKVYITGSNASMLSRELGTHLTGRFIEICLYPFSFTEFLKFKKFEYNHNLHLNTQEKIKLKRMFNEYLRLGGFPSYIKTEDNDYLKSLYESIIYRDIIVRYKLPQEKPLKEVVHYCASNIAKEISFNSMKDIAGIKSSTSIKEYFEYLENSFFVFLLNRFDYSLKKQIYFNKKVCFCDMAMANNIGFHFSEDFGRVLENIVFLQLQRQGKEIYFHKSKVECDFLVKEKNRIIMAIQVSRSLKNKETRDREIFGLIDAIKQYKLKSGLILTEDEEGDIKEGGYNIKIMPVWKWLLM
ncbi:MAG: ATP-binding protein [Elusimicrobiales bacterium]|nr:ATP-binding protein [Elusimicrobiales bacterium]